MSINEIVGTIIEPLLITLSEIKNGNHRRYSAEGYFATDDSVDSIVAKI